MEPSPMPVGRTAISGKWSDGRNVDRRVRAVLLAAGRGERLRPLTDSIAKPAVEVKGAPLGAYGLRLLTRVGGRIAINLSWLWDSAQAILRPYAPADTRWFIETPEPFGTARTIAALLSELAATFVVANADTITDLEVGALISTHERIGASATLAVQPVETGADLIVEGDRAIRLVHRRSEPAVVGVRYLGVGIFEREPVARALALTEERGLAEAVFAPFAENNDLAIHRHEGFAIDVGTPERLQEARQLSGLVTPTFWAHSER